MKCRIKRVRITNGGFNVEYYRVGEDVCRVVKLIQGHMPPGHELLRRGAVVDMVVQGGQVVYVCRAAQLIAQVGPVRCA